MVQVETTNIANKIPKMEVVNCLLCGSDQWRTQYALEDYHIGQPGKFTLVRCLDCGLLFLNPRPTADSMGLYYPTTYRAYDPVIIEKLPPLKRWLVAYGLRKRCQPLLKTKSAGKVLDIGCGSGHFLATLQKYSNWIGVGIDLSPEAIKFARETLNLEAYVGSLEAINFPANTFDAVTMWDALEHMRHPRQVLMEIQRILKPTGILLLRVPWLDSLDAGLFGKYWAGLDAPRHLTVFSHETLSRLLQETGFTIERFWCMSGSHASFIISLSFVASQPEQRWQLNLLRRILDNLLGAVLSAPYFFMIDKLKLGSEITVLAKK